jgi:hypothetical protein
MKIIAPYAIVDATLVSSNVTEADYQVYVPSTTYAKDIFVIATTGTHKIYQSLVASNQGNALTDTTKWLDCGATNRWKLHDQSVQSQSVNAGSISNRYAPVGRCNSIGLLNLEAAAVTVTVTDTTDGIIYAKTTSLTSSSGISDYYQYCFSPIDRRPDLVLTDLPSYSNVTIDVVISAPVGLAKCGALILGNFVNIGGTQYGAKIGITDYSIKTQDGFGGYTITKRGYRKTGDFSVEVRADYVDQLQLLLAKYRATPVLYIGADAYASSIIYGFYSDFSETISYPRMSLCSINILGLT